MTHGLHNENVLYAFRHQTKHSRNGITLVARYNSSSIKFQSQWVQAGPYGIKMALENGTFVSDATPGNQRTPMCIDALSREFSSATVFLQATAKDNDHWVHKHEDTFYPTTSMNPMCIELAPREEQKWFKVHHKDYTEKEKKNPDITHIWRRPVARVTFRDTLEASQFEQAWRFGMECPLYLIGAECPCQNYAYPAHHTMPPWRLLPQRRHHRP